MVEGVPHDRTVNLLPIKGPKPTPDMVSALRNHLPATPDFTNPAVLREVKARALVRLQILGFGAIRDARAKGQKTIVEASRT